MFKGLFVQGSNRKSHNSSPFAKTSEINDGVPYTLKKASLIFLHTVDSRYLEIEGTIINTSRYPYFDISDL